MGFLSWLFGKKKQKQPEKKDSKKTTKESLPVPPNPSPQKLQKLNQSKGAIKTQPYQEKQNQQLSQKEQNQLLSKNKNQWMYDSILQFLNSPLWKNPIEKFLDENCISFDEEEENHFIYQEIHKQFEQMIDGLLEHFINELQISKDQFLEQFQIGMEIQSDKKYFEQLIVAENFEKFKKQMVRMNKELELQALKQLQEEELKQNRINPGNTYAIEENRKRMERLELEKYEMELEHAIAMSLSMNEQANMMQTQEDEDLKKALMLSEIEHKRLINQQDEENKILEEKLKFSYNEELERQEKEQRLKKEEEEKRKLEEQKKQLEQSKKELEIEKQKQQKEHEEKIQKQKLEQKLQDEQQKKIEEEKKIVEKQKEEKLKEEKLKEEKIKEEKIKEEKLKEEKLKEEKLKEEEIKKQQQQLIESQEAAIAQAKAQEPHKSQQDVQFIESKVIDSGLVVDILKNKQKQEEQQAQQQKPIAQNLKTQMIQIEESKRQVKENQLGKEEIAENPKKRDAMSLQDLMRERLALKEKLEKMQKEDDDQKNIQQSKKKEEDLAERKKRLLQQRELILQKKKQDRDKNLENYNIRQEQIKGKEAGVDLKLQNFIGINDDKQNEEKNKHMELYSKIQSSLNQE